MKKLIESRAVPNEVRICKSDICMQKVAEKKKRGRVGITKKADWNISDLQFFNSILVVKGQKKYIIFLSGLSKDFRETKQEKKNLSKILSSILLKQYFLMNGC